MKQADPIAQYTRGAPIDHAQKCQRRVPDHTDFDKCGQPAVALGFCAEHRDEIAAALRQQVAEHHSAVALIERRLADLLAPPGGRDLAGELEYYR